MKSLQLFLNDFFDQLSLETVTPSAFSQARQKFRHTAFIELLEECTIAPFYADGDYETYKGHRLLSIDGSKARLPKSKEIEVEFGVLTERNYSHETRYCEAKISVLYDVRNRMPLHGLLARARQNDARLAEQHLDKLSANDLVLCDRGYASYRFFSLILSKNAHFVVRCKRRDFHDGYGLFESAAIQSKEAVLKRPVAEARNETLPKSITVRFVRVELDTGEVEVLATSLLDENVYPSEGFKSLYNERWKIETYYQVLKSRLCLEHFTGKTAESIRQDFHSTIYISALESMLIRDADGELKQRHTVHKLQVNKAISFNVLKEHAYALLVADGRRTEEILDELKALFMQTPTLSRPLRDKTRKRKTRNTYSWASLNFFKNVKRQIF